MLVKKAPQIVAAKQRLEELAHNFDVRKMAARMEDQKEDYYILCGWMSEDDVARFMEEVKDDDKVFVVVEEDRNTYFGDPPVKLQNPKHVRTSCSQRDRSDYFCCCHLLLYFRSYVR